jgi:hypothetical protein
MPRLSIENDSGFSESFFFCGIEENRADDYDARAELAGHDEAA